MNEVTANIKMYRIGELGDCFLLRFSDGTEASNVLIDCGAFSNSAAAKSRLKTIAGDIKTSIGSEKIDVLIGTHQHNDHLSGFVHAEADFRSIPVEQVYLSWLDDPDDSQARQNGILYNNFLQNLQGISVRLNTLQGAVAARTKQALDDVLGFSGINTPAVKPKTKKFPPAIPQQAIGILRTLGRKKIKYLDQGEIFDLPGLPENSVKVYVLGPPRNEGLLYDITPNKTETFDPELALAGNQAEKFLLALNNNALYNRSGDNEEEPFPFYERDSDSSNLDQIMSRYYNRQKTWRTIDEDWLNQAQRLGLWLNSYTNNSSLVVAFELVKSNKVLLFAADAQTGNWNSWKDISWKNKPATFTWKSLLERTVFYKVGHHGSHNATLVEGLNLMTHDELVAMIPVDRSDSHVAKGPDDDGWKMPAENLYANLKQRTKFRLLRMDDGFADECKPTTQKIKDAWKGLNMPTIDPLFLEYTVK